MTKWLAGDASALSARIVFTHAASDLQRLPGHWLGYPNDYPSRNEAVAATLRHSPMPEDRRLHSFPAIHGMPLRRSSALVSFGAFLVVMGNSHSCRSCHSHSRAIQQTGRWSTMFWPCPAFIIAFMSKKLRWGVLSTANIGLKKVLPAMQRGQFTSVDAIASRDLARAQSAAAALGIPKAYGSYEELIADPDIDAIYNPLPNQMHVPWTIRAAEAGKHVLCEKPLGMTAAEAQTLVAMQQKTGVKIGEAFMVDSFPQWLRVQELLAQGRVGELRSITGFFSYFNVDPNNIRNHMESGGGALMDIGCYLVHASRRAFAKEPHRVVGLIDRDPQMQTDRLTSAMLDFENGQSIFTCSTQLVPYQRIHFLGTRGRIEIEIPFNAPPDRPTRIFIDGGDLFGGNLEIEVFPTQDQYTLQGDAFSKAVLEGGEVPVPVEDAVKNMAVIDAIFDSAATGEWKSPQVF